MASLRTPYMTQIVRIQLDFTLELYYIIIAQKLHLIRNKINDLLNKYYNKLKHDLTVSFNSSKLEF